MKSFTSIAKIGIGIAIATGVAACGNKGNTPSDSQASTNDSTKSAVLTAEKIVYVNSDSLLANYTYAKEVNARIEAKGKKAQSELQAKGTAFQREVADYQQKAATMSGQDRQNTEERLARKQQELAQHEQNAGAAFSRETADENEKLYNKIADYLKIHAKAKGYKLVLTYTKASPNILFADESLEVTKEVVDGLNEAYKKENQK
ncbi:OmpH family outer membrane protein [Olivibacter sitiensis]|uniref:OmpH family outer membrane protein n=1 Tax=Olivibacter sitiensis TaxID=376470 RepID=UPI0003FD12AF|nr:OmpH family outer membrane protein [Olivibacter sitiensis]